ncbi:hypothetical protein E2C01_070874 [Portunus trituberculatus]|uniref:Uncharacterized protein n=1 Tax=Portunus trituberculatus TaxID=210409 RepID=A0A5B7HTW3_PORTR|nr:hypothetical protein [Portunus trituberculatus]
MRVPNYQIKKEEYIEVVTCFKCYKLDDHYSSQCPEEKDFTICSECSSHNHTWMNCSSNIKTCINCNGHHRTLSYQCPTRKNIEKQKRQLKSTTYAAAASSQTLTNPLQNISRNFNEDTKKLDNIITSVVIAHFQNIINPGSFLTELNASLRDNNIAEIKLSNKNPNYAKLFKETNTNDPLGPHHLTIQPTYKKQDNYKKQKETHTLPSAEDISDSDGENEHVEIESTSDVLSNADQVSSLQHRTTVHLSDRSLRSHADIKSTPHNTNTLHTDTSLHPDNNRHSDQPDEYTCINGPIECNRGKKKPHKVRRNQH